MLRLSRFEIANKRLYLPHLRYKNFRISINDLKAFDGIWGDLLDWVKALRPLSVHHILQN